MHASVVVAKFQWVQATDNITYTHVYHVLMFADFGSVS